MGGGLSHSIWKFFNHPSAVPSVDLMLHIGITRINGPNITFVVILFEMEAGVNWNMVQNYMQI